MTPLYLKLVVPMACLLTALMIVIHAQSFDDPTASQFLTPDNCTMPCFMGITPGVTPVDEAISILNHSGWVKNLTMPPQYASRDDNVIIWQWNDRFPVRATTTLHEAPYGNFLAVKGDLVDSLVVTTSITLAEVELLWKRPAQYVVAPVAAEHLYYGYVYPEKGVHVIGEARCPYVPNFWTNATNLVMGAIQKDFQTGNVPYDQLFLKQVIQFDHKICGG